MYIILVSKHVQLVERHSGVYECGIEALSVAQFRIRVECAFPFQTLAHTHVNQEGLETTEVFLLLGIRSTIHAKAHHRK